MIIAVPPYRQSLQFREPHLFPLRDNVSRTHEPIVVWTIIGLNVSVFLYQLNLGPRELQLFFYHHALVPNRYLSPGWAREVGLSPTDLSPFLTNTFMHGGWLHIILNMWTLWIFGPALEDRLGPFRFAILYVLAGIGGSVTHAFFNAMSPTPVLGASGAISGIIAAYAVRFPYAWVRVLVLIVFIPLFFSIPAMLFAGIWFFTQVLQGTSELLSPFGGNGVAWWAHIGGFVSGWLLLHWLQHPARSTVRYNGGPWER